MAQKGHHQAMAGLSTWRIRYSAPKPRRPTRPGRSRRYGRPVAYQRSRLVGLDGLAAKPNGSTRCKKFADAAFALDPQIRTQPELRGGCATGPGC